MAVTMTMPQARRHCASIDGQELKLSPHHHRVLECMLLHRPHHASPDALIAAVWPHPDDEPENASGQVRIYLHFLRKQGFPISFAGYGWGYGCPDLLEVEA
jgi:DNA-binding response OmpR family regulator